MKCHLQCVISEELSCQLVSTNFKDLSYLQLVQKCQMQDNQLHAAVTNACKTMPRSQLPNKPNHTRVSLPLPDQSTLPPTLPMHTMPEANAMDLIRFKLTVQERGRCCTQGLCFHCGLASHITLSCSSKPSGEHIETIQEASTA